VKTESIKGFIWTGAYFLLGALPEIKSAMLYSLIAMTSVLALLWATGRCLGHVPADTPTNSARPWTTKNSAINHSGAFCRESSWGYWSGRYSSPPRSWVEETVPPTIHPPLILNAFRSFRALVPTRSKDRRDVQVGLKPTERLWASRGRPCSGQTRTWKTTLGSEWRSVRALRIWNPSEMPQWLDEDTYRREILPLLSNFTVKVIRLKLDVSHPYATLIRRGQSVPHPRHWLPLADLTGYGR